MGRMRASFVHEGVRYGYAAWLGSNSETPEPSLVLLHGFAQSAATWADAAERLAADRNVFAFELAGHGESDRPEDSSAYGLEAQGKALLAFFLHLAARGEEAANPLVVGYSLGGRVALAAALHDPTAFAASASGLVLESAGLGPATARERAVALQQDARNAAALRTGGLEAFMDTWEQLPLFATQRNLSIDARERLRSGRLANSAEALARTLEGAGQHAMPDRAAVLGGLRALADKGLPVLYVAGALDAKYRALADDLREAGICGVRVIKGAGHNVHLEAFAAFVAAVGAVSGR